MIYAWGNNADGELGVGNTLDYNGTILQVSFLSYVTQISAGAFFNMALLCNSKFDWFVD